MLTIRRESDQGILLISQLRELVFFFKDADGIAELDLGKRLLPLSKLVGVAYAGQDRDGFAHLVEDDSESVAFACVGVVVILSSPASTYHEVPDATSQLSHDFA